MSSAICGSRAAVRGRVGGSPLSSHQVAMPSKERLRRHHEGGPAVPGEHSARRSEERPIAIYEVRVGVPCGEAP